MNPFTRLTIRDATMKAFLILAASLLGSSPSFAADFTYRDLNNGNYIIDLRGDIEQGDSVKLAQLIANEPEKFLGTTNLSLHSPGGSVSEAIKISQLIKLSGIGVIVEKNELCASSCFFIWVSGDFRTSFTTSRIIIHRPYIPTDSVTLDNAESSSTATSSMLVIMRQFLIEQNVPTVLIDKMMQLPSSEGYTLTEVDMARSIGFMSPILEEKSIRHCGVSNNTILDSPDVQKSVLCISGILHALRFPFLVKLIGYNAATTAANIRSRQITERHDTPTNPLSGKNIEITHSPPIQHNSQIYGLTPEDSAKESLLLYKKCMELAADHYSKTNSSPSEAAIFAHTDCESEFHFHQDMLARYFSSLVTRSGQQKAVQEAASLAETTRTRAMTMVIKIIREKRRTN